jgi:hypothetical protein
VSGISDLIARSNTAGLSARALSRAARERGYTLNHDTAARYLRGDHGLPDEVTLMALSDVLNIPLRKLRAAAGLPTDSIEPYVPPAEASRLTRRQRRAVDEIIRAMLEPTRASIPPIRTDRRRAARHGRAEPPDAG